MVLLHGSRPSSNSPATLVLGLLLATWPSQARPQVAITLTGAAVAAGLDAAASRAADLVDKVGKELADSLKQSLLVASADLRRTLADNLATPINNLNEGLQRAANQAQAILSRATADLDAIRSCAGFDARLIAQTLDASLAANLSALNSIIADPQWVITTMIALGDNSRYGIRAQAAPTAFRVGGAFPGLDVTCGDTKAVLVGPDGARQPLMVSSSDTRVVVVTVPSVGSKGLYKVHIEYSYRDRPWYLLWLARICRSTRSVEASFAVGAPANFRVDYSAIPSCPVKHPGRTKETLLGASDGDQDRDHGATLCVDPGFTRDECVWVETAKNGKCDGKKEESGSECCVGKVHCDKSGFRGPGYNVNGKLQLVQFTSKLSVGPAADGRLQTPLGFNQQVQERLVDPSSMPVKDSSTSAKDCHWTVSANVIWPDEHRSALPARSGLGHLNLSSGDGVSAEWIPESGNLAVTTPKAVCEYYY